MHQAAAAIRHGQAVGMSEEVWKRLPVSEMRLCAGAAAELCDAAGSFLPGMPGALPQYRAVYGERGGGVGLL